MADTTFVNGSTLSDADWFNDVNRLHYTILSDPANAAAVLTAIGGAALGANSFTAIQKWAKGADVASANALTLGTDGNYFDITGTTAITSIGTLGIGVWVKLHFDGILTLTHHATDLILPGAANITTAAGDEAEFVEYASGDWRCTAYTKASGAAVVASGGITLGTPVASTSGTAVSLSTTIPAGTKRIVITPNGVSTNGTSPLIVQVGPSGGLTTSGYVSLCYTSGATRQTATTGILASGVNTQAGGTIQGQIILCLSNSSTNTWVATTLTSDPAGAGNDIWTATGSIALAGALTRISVTTVNGTDAFDAGEIGFMYE